MLCVNSVLFSFFYSSSSNEPTPIFCRQTLSRYEGWWSYFLSELPSYRSAVCLNKIMAREAIHLDALCRPCLHNALCGQLVMFALRHGRYGPELSVGRVDPWFG
jgi:hypothetical protein